MINPGSFFSAWISVCKSRERDILDNWETATDYTTLILGGNPDAIVAQVAQKLDPTGQLRTYSDYYALDAVFYAEGEDLVVPRPIGSTWIQNVRVAFEHENFFTSGLFQETSHLLITRAELRVLVTYPEHYPVAPELDRLSAVIAGSGLADPAFLLITGQRKDDADNSRTVEWLAYTFQEGRLARFMS